MGSLSLLVSDVDGTLLGDTAALDEFSQWREATRGRVRLAYNSGRFFDSVLRSVRDDRLPMPDAMVGGVGTEIRFPDSGGRLSDWPPTDPAWDVGTIRHCIAQEFPEFTLQPEEFQSSFKVSYWARELSNEKLIELRAALTRAVGPVELIYSSQRDLDVLPPSANKGAAVARLAEHWRIAPERVVVAGDTGNDAAMFGRGFRGIIVGNADRELRSLAGPDAYLATGRCAAGVLEGLRHWLPESFAMATSDRPRPGRDGDRGRRG